MNWLAHLFLSEPTPAFRVGNLLPDLAPAGALASLPPEFRRGIEQHRRIDAFTDSHPVVRRSADRFPPPLRRYAGVLVDVFYDHFLARRWGSYASQPLPEFAREVYASFDLLRESIPPVAYGHLERMRSGDWLCSYQDLPGVSDALARIAGRLRRPADLGAAIVVLEESYDAFDSEFRAFFPELRVHVASS